MFHNANASDDTSWVCDPTRTPLENTGAFSRCLLPLRRCSIMVLGMLLVLHGWSGAVMAMQQETLCYRGTYQGPLSAGDVWTVAGITLQRQPASLELSGTGGQEAILTVSSERAPHVEKLFPFRLRYRSLATAGWSETLAQEALVDTGAPEWEVAWLDAQGQRQVRYRNEAGSWRGAEPHFQPAQWLGNAAGSLQPYDQRAWAWSGMDRLSLLQHLRGLALADGAEYQFQVWESRRRFLYEASVDSVQQVPGIPGRLAWRVSLEGERIRRDSREPAHPPVVAWIEAAPPHRPLRLEQRHSLGLFVVLWTGDGDAGRCSVDLE
jgi:hypothetical protein